MAVELTLESGAINGEHVLNVLARLQHPARMVQDIATAMTLRQPPASDPASYDRLRQEIDFVHAAQNVVLVGEPGTGKTPWPLPWGHRSLSEASPPGRRLLSSIELVDALEKEQAQGETGQIAMRPA